MGAKLKSKTHLQNTFFDFLSRFLRVWLQRLKKVQIWPKKIFFDKKSKRCQKTQNFTLISNSLKKLWKNAQQKVISKTSLTNKSKSEKSAFFRHVFANNFFLVHFFKTFQYVQYVIITTVYCTWHHGTLKIRTFVQSVFTFFHCKNRVHILL